MSRPILWRSSNGRLTVNLCTVASVYTQTDGELLLYTAGERASDGVKVRREDAKSFLLALDAAAAPAVSPDTARLTSIVDRLNDLDGDMATVGGNRLVEIVRDLARTLGSRP